MKMSKEEKEFQAMTGFTYEQHKIKCAHAFDIMGAEQDGDEEFLKEIYAAIKDGGMTIPKYGRK